MPMTKSNQSMFPPTNFTFEEKIFSCNKAYGVKPRPHWITTEYGGYVSM
jgi:lysosomal Pro-X carboxypeptidase